jgi:acyl-coenzyme A thioesterase PaaI-like protein
MNVATLPFNQLIGLQLSPPETGFETCLPEGSQYTNHLGAVHASAMLAVAEAGSGAFLVRHFSNHAGLVPIVRRLEAKFRNPGSGKISAKCVISPETLASWDVELSERGRLFASVPVEVVDIVIQ